MGQTAERADSLPRAESPQRPIPYPVAHSLAYERALQNGTRSESGEPGPGYWLQWAEYTLRARIEPDEQRLEGAATILYHNNSPDTLGVLYLNLLQNLHAEGAPRNRPQEVTGGIQLRRVAVEGQALSKELSEGPRYSVEATVLRIDPLRPLPPGESVNIEIDWTFKIPTKGADDRMGWEEDLFFLAYWYPQMAVYNDVVGWQIDWFMGGSEFYAGFGRYDLTVEVPPGWVVMGTGRLANAEEVLAPRVIDRLRRAEESDEVVHVITSDDLASGVTRPGRDGLLAWHFLSDSVRDVAFSVTRASLWDAARTPVGDRDGDGAPDYARVDAIYKENAPKWKQAVRYGQHSIAFLSEYTGVPYPWPHMTAVEAGFRGGGMEYPMMTLIGDYNERSDSALYYVTAHELAHMWV
ncbi:MAG: peptidase, partial [Gemmatimonas sp. SG8_38_2]